jgi:nitroreductase
MADLASIDEILTTTRSVRKRLDLTRPVEPEVIERCLEIATQAPTGSNSQRYHFIVVTDPDLRAGLADLYRRSFDRYIGGRGARRDADEPVDRVLASAIYLADNFHAAPVHVIFAYEGRTENGSVASQAGFYGSILPAAWSFMLALRARGLGTAWTTLHLAYEQEAAALLGIPANYTQTVLFPVAYYNGDSFKPARRTPLEEHISWNGWGRKREV